MTAVVAPQPFRPPPCRNMEFLQEIPAVSLVANPGVKHACFAAEMFSPRPDFQVMRAYASWSRTLQGGLAECMGLGQRTRSACPVSWVQIVVDERGAWLLAASQTEQTTGNMRQAISTILKLLSQLPE